MKFNEYREAGYCYEGDMVGVEIEAMFEGGEPPEPVRGGAWKGVGDGSLRGASMEYVLRHPLNRKDVGSAISELYKSFGDTKLVDAGRTGVHIHINVADMEITHLFNFITLFLMLERPVVSVCGEHREGNLFCLRGCDAEDIYPTLNSVIRYEDFGILESDDLRYYAMNLKALVQYGSLEFRCMNFPVTEEQLLNWIDILLDLKRESVKYDSPFEVIGQFSMEEPLKFIRNRLPRLVNSLPRPLETYSPAIMEDMRATQEFACLPIGFGAGDGIRVKMKRPGRKILNS